VTRLIVVVEGQTEEAFVNDVLAPHLLKRDVYATATIVGKVNAQRRGHRGRGGGHFRHWRRDLERILGNDRNADLRVTTLFDLYGLPEDFPSIEEYGRDADTNRRCDALQAALGDAFGDYRLIPYIQRHEFESLVLASLSSLGKLLDAQDDLEGLAQLEAGIRQAAPEDINDGADTAPSKRLLASVPGYVKTLHGPLAIADTGMVTVRSRCSRFDAWISKLETLGT
jgi:hypothetical protein